MSTKTKEDILRDVGNESMFVTYDDIIENTEKEIHEAMEQYAQQEAIGFNEWKDKCVAMRATNGRFIVTTFSGLDFNETYTTEQLYNAYQQSKNKS